MSVEEWTIAVLCRRGEMSETQTSFNYQVLCHPGTTTIEVLEAIDKFLRKYHKAKRLEISINIETSRSDSFVAHYGPGYESVANIRLVVG